jgi:hypothetical protein
MSKFTSSLGYEAYDSSSYTKIPPPKVNGGWFTGESSSGKPWGTVPVVPDSGYMTYANLKTANPPPLANVQYGDIRPGNNCFLLQDVGYYDKEHHNFYCFGGKNTAANINECNFKAR